MKFEIGNKIYCSYHEAAGTITDIKYLEMHPIICVTFEDGNTDMYTKQGRRLQSGDICLYIVENETSKKESGSLTL